MAEAKAKGIPVEKVKALRIKQMTRQADLISTSQICQLSDEIASSDGAESRSKASDEEQKSGAASSEENSDPRLVSGDPS